MNLRQAAQRALKAMEDGEDRADMIEFSDALSALRAALAEPEQNQPLAWFHLDEKTNESFLVWFPSADGKDWRPLYAAPRKQGEQHE